MNRSDISQDNPVFGNLESARQEFIPLIRKLFQRAIHFDRTDDIDLLLQNGVEIDREDTDAIRLFIAGKSIDHDCFLACEGYSCIIDWLVSDCGWSVGRVLQQAFSEGHEAGMQCLLEYGLPDKEKFETLSKAAMKDQWDMVELLLKHGFKRDDMYQASYNELRNKFTGSGDRTVRLLHHAASKGYGVIVGLLLKNGEDNNSKDDDGQVAVHFAADGGHKEIVQQLLDHGADKKAKNNDGLTALHLASAGGHDSTVQLLIQHFRADKEAKTNDGSTALHLASAAGHDSTIQLIIQKFGADRKAKNNAGKTALYLLVNKVYVSDFDCSNSDHT
jgi:ankyrin repeat protein